MYNKKYHLELYVYISARSYIKVIFTKDCQSAKQAEKRQKIWNNSTFSDNGAYIIHTSLQETDLKAFKQTSLHKITHFTYFSSIKTNESYFEIYFWCVYCIFSANFFFRKHFVTAECRLVVLLNISTNTWNIMKYFSCIRVMKIYMLEVTFWLLNSAYLYCNINC